MFRYKTKGTCSKYIELDIGSDNKINNVHFDGGCNGNLQGVSKLVVGQDAFTVMNMMEGIKCQGLTSCPDQLSKAIKSYYESKE